MLLTCCAFLNPEFKTKTKTTALLLVKTGEGFGLQVSSSYTSAALEMLWGQYQLQQRNTITNGHLSSPAKCVCKLKQEFPCVDNTKYMQYSQEFGNITGKGISCYIVWHSIKARNYLLFLFLGWRERGFSQPSLLQDKAKCF